MMLPSFSVSTFVTRLEITETVFTRLIKITQKDSATFKTVRHLCKLFLSVYTLLYVQLKATICNFAEALEGNIFRHTRMLKFNPIILEDAC